MMPALDPVLPVTLRVTLSVLLLWAAGHKLRDVAGFREAVAGYRLLPSLLISPAAVLLIAAELGIAAGLCLPRFGSAGALVAAALLSLYGGAILVNLARGRRDIDCGCLGAAGRQPLSAGLVVRNGVLVAAALASALPMTGRPLAWIGGLTVFASVAALLLLYAAVDGLLAHAPRLAALRRGGEVAHA